MGVPTYFDIIKEPMDFGTISVSCLNWSFILLAMSEPNVMQQRLKKGKYEILSQFERDVQLVFSNALTFNEPDSEIPRRYCRRVDLYLLIPAHTACTTGRRSFVVSLTDGRVSCTRSSRRTRKAALRLQHHLNPHTRAARRNPHPLLPAHPRQLRPPRKEQPRLLTRACWLACHIVRRS